MNILQSMKVISNFNQGTHRFQILDLSIEDLDNIKKSLYYTGWFNQQSARGIIASVQQTYFDLCNAIENREHYVNGILTDPTSKISKP